MTADEHSGPVGLVGDETTSLEVSVVMPCLNEAATVGRCIRKAQTTLRELGVSGEVVVADNGSTDGSPVIASEQGARVVHVSEKGYGNALMAGIAASRGQYVIMGDADDSYDFNGLAPFVDKLRSGYDFVIGNRFHGGIERGAMPFLHQYLGNPILSFFGRAFFRAPIGDIYCGLRGFRKTAVEALDLHSGGMEFAIEMIVKATLRGMSVTEVPTTLSPDGRGRPPHLRTWRDGWRSLRFLLLYSPAWLFFYPGSALILAGAVTTVWLLPGARSVGGVAFDVHTLLYAGLAVIIGFQGVLFGICARYFGVSAGLLPEESRLTRIFRYARLELGLLVGGALVAAGMAASVFAVARWRAREFGELDYASTLRIVIPAAIVTVVGFQIILSSFFLAILGLKRR